MRITLTSYHATSGTSPVNPSSTTTISATITSVWPFCSRRKLAVRIHRHDGAVRHRELVEHRNEKAKRGPSLVRGDDRDSPRVGGGDVISRAGLPLLLKLEEVQLLAVDHRAGVEPVSPNVYRAGGL